MRKKRELKDEMVSNEEAKKLWTAPQLIEIRMEKTEGGGGVEDDGFGGGPAAS